MKCQFWPSGDYAGCRRKARWSILDEKGKRIGVVCNEHKQFGSFNSRFETKPIRCKHHGH
jgi:hypothetical protein